MPGLQVEFPGEGVPAPSKDKRLRGREGDGTAKP